MNVSLGYSIDEFGDFYKNNITHEKIQHTCDMCKMTFDADHIAPEHLPYPIYNDSDLKICIRKNNVKRIIPLDMCPECAEKLLEILDEHFPKLNLEEEIE